MITSNDLTGLPLEDRIRILKAASTKTLSLEDKLTLKAAKRIPIYIKPRVDPETGRCDCGNRKSKKMWKRENYTKALKERYKRRYK